MAPTTTTHDEPRFIPWSETTSRQGRRNVLAACEMCRKRKTRCNGKIPCSFCIKNSFACEINTAMRQRRGPAPKTPLRRHHHDTAARRTASLDRRRVIVAERHTPPLEDENWGRRCSHISQLLRDQDKQLFDLHLSAELCLHLLQVFISHVHNFQPWIIDPPSFYDDLESRRCSLSLVYAICALSIPFSRHRVLKSSGMVAAIRAELAKRARNYIVEEPHHRSSVPAIQALCVLTLYEFTVGNGTQAWLDVSSASARIQVCVQRGSLAASDARSLGLASRYLSLTERSYRLGLWALYPSIPDGLFPHRVLTTCPALVSGISVESSTLCQLLHLMQEALEMSSAIKTTSDLPPWHERSAIMEMNLKLELQLIKGVEAKQNPSSSCPSDGDVVDREIWETALCVLCWHCSSILINGRFLPVAVLQSGPDGAPRKLRVREYPGAPQPFLEERASACQKNAIAIARICKSLLRHETMMMPALLGYCCFHATAVFLGQLQQNKEAEKLLSESLLTSLAVLGAMQQFYKPTQVWIKQLLKMEEPQLLLSRANLNQEQLFSTYWSRYPGIEQACFINLEPFEESSPRPPAGPSPIHMAGARQSVVEFSEGQGTTEKTVESSWVSGYRSHLRHCLDELSDDSHTEAEADIGGDLPSQGASFSSSQPSDEYRQSTAQVSNSREPPLSFLEPSVHHGCFENDTWNWDSSEFSKGGSSLLHTLPLGVDSEPILEDSSFFQNSDAADMGLGYFDPDYPSYSQFVEERGEVSGVVNSFLGDRLLNSLWT